MPLFTSGGLGLVILVVVLVLLSWSRPRQQDQDHDILYKNLVLFTSLVKTGMMGLLDGQESIKIGLAI